MVEIKKTLIIGAGEIGTSLRNIFASHYETIIIDKNNDFDWDPEIIHIAFPYSKNFVKYVKSYQKKYKPKFTVIHSTVPVGTSRKCNAVHSPVVGLHPFMEESIKTFTKYLGGEHSSLVAQYFRRANIKIYITDKSETTELMKILSTSFYGVLIEWTKEVKRLCNENNVPFEMWTIWTNNYNSGYTKLGHPEYVRPNLVPIMTGQGGHCTQSNAANLHRETKSEFLKIVLSGGVISKDKLNDSVWMYCEYIGKERTSVDIAKELNVSDVTIRNRLNKFDIKIRDRSWTQVEFDKILELSEDKNFKEIAKEINRTYNSVRNVCYKELKIKSNYSPGEETKKLEVREKISAKLQGVDIDSWDGFTETESALIRKSVPYVGWRTLVFQRDNFICQNKDCKYCKNKKSVNLHSHHVKSFSKHPDLRFDVNNGMTYCAEYHMKSDLHKNQKLEEQNDN